MENKREIYGKMLEIRNKIDGIKALDSNYLENEEYKENIKLFNELEEKLKENTEVENNQEESGLDIYEKKQKTKKWEELKKFVKGIIRYITKNDSRNM